MTTNYRINVPEFMRCVEEGTNTEMLHGAIALNALFSADFFDSMALAMEDGDVTSQFYRRNVDVIASYSLNDAKALHEKNLNVFASFVLRVNREYHKTTGKHLCGFLKKANNGRFLLTELEDLAEDFIYDFEKYFGSFEAFQKANKRHFLALIRESREKEN